MLPRNRIVWGNSLEEDSGILVLGTCGGHMMLVTAERTEMVIICTGRSVRAWSSDIGHNTHQLVGFVDEFIVTPVTENGTFGTAGMGGWTFQNTMAGGTTTKTECWFVKGITASFSISVLWRETVGGKRGRIRRIRKGLYMVGGASDVRKWGRDRWWIIVKNGGIAHLFKHGKTHGIIWIN